MGALSEQAGTPPPPRVTGTGARLVEWWQGADEDDRALFRSWVTEGSPTRLPQHEIAERLTAAGWQMSTHTVHHGLRLLRRLPEWAS